MTRFDRYMLRQLLAVFGFFALVIVGINWINRAVEMFDQLIAEGQSARTFLSLMLLSLPFVAQLALPVAAFAAAIHVTNRLTTESELVVAQAMGVSPWRMARPVLAFGVILGVVMAGLVHVLVPQSRAALAERQASIAGDVAARMLSEGRFLNPADGVTFYIREITPEGELRGIFLSDAREGGQRTDYLATRGYLVDGAPGDTGSAPALVMFDGSAQTFDEADARLSTTTFESFTYALATLFEPTGRARRSVREYPTPVLFAPGPEALAETRRSPEEFMFEAHVRMVQPVVPLVAALLGFAVLQLGGHSRFGVWRQIAAAIGLIVLVQLAENAVADLARRDMALWPLLYAPMTAAAAITLGLLWRAAAPRRLGPRGLRRRRAPPPVAAAPEAPR